MRTLTLFMYILSVTKLLDKDECAVNFTCCSNTICTNTAGSYECACVTGFQKENGYCTGITLDFIQALFI